MEKRGVLYMSWGDSPEVIRSLERSIASVKEHHPELPVHVAKVEDNKTTGLDYHSLILKSRMFGLTPFEETLYLDVDTVVLGRLDFAFEKAAKFSMACGICECPWARRYGGLSGDMVEYNTGVLFFTKDAGQVFERWEKHASGIDSSVKFIRDGKVHMMASNDQAGFSQAVDELDFLPFILPYNWNFRPQWHKSFFGPIKIWHDYADVPPILIKWNKKQSLESEIIQFCDFS